jgi:ribosomal protein S11
MEVKHTKTRWYFSAALPDGYVISGCVEFSVNENRKKVVSVFDTTGRALLWSSTGVQRTSQASAKLAFKVYAEQEAKKATVPMKLAFTRTT